MLHEKLLTIFTKSHPTGALKFHLKILSIQRLINLLCYASVNSTCTQPPTPTTAGHMPTLSVTQSRGQEWGICKFCTAWGPAFANPGAIPELLTRTRFPIRI